MHPIKGPDSEKHLLPISSVFLNKGGLKHVCKYFPGLGFASLFILCVYSLKVSLNIPNAMGSEHSSIIHFAFFYPLFKK